MAATESLGGRWEEMSRNVDTDYYYSFVPFVFFFFEIFISFFSLSACSASHIYIYNANSELHKSHQPYLVTSVVREHLNVFQGDVCAWRAALNICLVSRISFCFPSSASFSCHCLCLCCRTNYAHCANATYLFNGSRLLGVRWALTQVKFDLSRSESTT